MTGPVDTPIGLALAEVGGLIEEAEPHTRKAQVRAHIEAMTDTERVDFLCGVFIVAHEMRLWEPPK